MTKTKSSAKKTTAKRTGVKSATKAAKSKQVRVASKVKDEANCKAPTTLFEVEFPTTVLFWAGVALFFLFILLIAQTVKGGV